MGKLYLGKYDDEEPSADEMAARIRRREKVVFSAIRQGMPFKVVVRFPDIGWDCHAHIVALDGHDVGAFVVEHEDMPPTCAEDLIPYTMAGHPGLDNVSMEWRQILFKWCDTICDPTLEYTNWMRLSDRCIKYAAVHIFIAREGDEVPFNICTKLPDENGSDHAYIIQLGARYGELGSFMITALPPKTIDDLIPFTGNEHLGLDGISKEDLHKIVKWASEKNRLEPRMTNWQMLSFECSIAKESYPEFCKNSDK